MRATYTGDKALNVRTEPSRSAAVVHTMAPGEESACSKVEGGWATLQDGYAMAEYLRVEEGEAAEPEKPAEAQTEPEVKAEQPAEPDPEDGAELMKMTNSQLYDLAEKSGIPTKGGMTKKQLVAAILNADA